jgi:hypothetical protein
MGESKFAGIFQQGIAEEARTPERPAVLKALGRPPGKRSDPAYKQYSLLLKRQTHRKVDSILREDENGPDMSELVQQLLDEWLERQGK